MAKKRMLITGGAGFIGSHLCERFLARDFTVICMDNLITGQKENISHLLKEKNFLFIEHNVTRYISLKGRIDYILHFASPASPEDYLKFPIQTLKVGSLGTHNALGLAKEKKAVFMLASTSEVYGDPLVHPQPETYWGHVNSIGVRGCYDESKRFAEAITMAYHRMHRLDTRIARIFNTYGPRMRLHDGRVVPNFISQILQGRPLTVYGRGRQTRSFCFVDDLVEAISRLVLTPFHEPINLGNPEEFSILEFARKIISISGARNKIIFKPLPQDDPRQRRPNISRAKKILKWQPKVSLDEGLTKTLRWFRLQ